MIDDMAFEQFCHKFDSEETCIQALFETKWPGGFLCPKCTNQHYYLILTRRLPLYECSLCHAQTSITAGTIMERSRTPLKRWFQAIFLHAQPGGVNATHLASIIGTTYKTSWLICHKIRQAMSQADSTELLNGLVHVNWGNYGTPYNPTVFRHHQEHPLLVGASYDLIGEITQLKIKQVHDQYLQDNHITAYAGQVFKNQHVNPDTTDVLIVNQKYSRNRFRPLIKICLQAAQWINDIFKGIGSKHLQSYLDQFCYSNNWTKRSKNMFAVLLHHCLMTPALTYPLLISRENHSLLFKNRYLNQLRNVS